MKTRSLMLSIAAGLLVSGIGALDARAGTEVTLPQPLASSDPTMGLTSTTLSLPAVYTSASNGNFFVTANGLTYSDFSYTSTATGTGLAYPATSVGVTSFSNGTDSGFTLNAGWLATSGNTLDIALTYTVTAAAGSKITDAFLGITGSLSGTGTATVGETLTGSTGVIGSLTAGLPSPLSDSISFAGVQSIIVNKDLILGGGTNGSASVSFLTQGFSVNTVPEPTSMALLGIGMTGFLAFRRLFKRKAVA